MKSEKLFRNIRNRIQRHNGNELLSETIRLLNHPNATNLERLRHFPIWYLLLFVKWVILYGDFRLNRSHKQVSTHFINEFMKRLHELPNHVRKPSQYQNLLLYLRNVAFQQFWIQEPYTVQRIARQFVLFGQIEPNHRFQGLFRTATGLSINEFLELSVILLTHVQSKPGAFISENFFSPVAATYSPDAVRIFLNSISQDVTSARAWLEQIEAQKDERERTVDYEFVEQSPLIRFPLLRNNTRYMCISPILLQHSLQFFLYDTLKELDAEGFMEKFGAMFETYVKNNLQPVFPTLLTEADFREHFGNQNDQKVVDFLIVDGENNIFIDAKGVAMSWIGMVTHLPGTIRNQSKSSIIKGIKQAYAVAEGLARTKSVNSVKLGTEENYLLIVTFKDLYVGNGQDFRDLIAPEEIDAVIAKYGGREWIPLKNIYFISIDDLEILIGCSKEASGGASELLKYARESDESPERKKFVFRQHVFQVCPDVDMLPILESANTELIERVQSRITQSE